MIKKGFDYYYWALFLGFENIQGKDRFFTFHVTGIMSFTLSVNLLSLILFIDHHILVRYTWWMCLGFWGVSVLLMNILDRIYNKKRREGLRVKYEIESMESLRNRAVSVWFFEILSFAFFIWALFMTERPL